MLKYGIWDNLYLCSQAMVHQNGSGINYRIPFKMRTVVFALTYQWLIRTLSYCLSSLLLRQTNPSTNQQPTNPLSIWPSNQPPVNQPASQPTNHHPRTQEAVAGESVSRSPLATKSVWGQPGLKSKLQDSKYYTEKPCVKKLKKEKKKHFDTSNINEPQEHYTR